jgi:hypothetical protein
VTTHFNTQFSGKFFWCNWVRIIYEGDRITWVTQSVQGTSNAHHRVKIIIHLARIRNAHVFKSKDITFLTYVPFKVLIVKEYISYGHSRLVPIFGYFHAIVAKDGLNIVTPKVVQGDVHSSEYQVHKLYVDRWVQEWIQRGARVLWSTLLAVNST